MLSSTSAPGLPLSLHAFAPVLPEAATLVQELLAFQVKLTPQGHDTYGTWREGNHDDLVLAVALTCWYGEQGGCHQLALRSIL